MAVNPRLWYPVSIVLAIVNVAAIYVVGRGSPGASGHMMLHAALAVGSAAWAVHLRSRLRDRIPGHAGEAALMELRDDVENLREHVRELEERLDFTERMLAQQRDWERLEQKPPGSTQ
jgi:hypothetical protein